MTYASVLRAAGALAFGLLAALRVSAAADPLPALAADQSRVSVSGLSSGGYMAGQFQIAYSKLVTGAGIVAGGPYGCAQTPGASVIPFWPVVLGLNLDRAQKRCMKDGGWFSDVPPAGLLADQVTALADKERIDPVADVKTDRIYVFSGAKDTTVQREVVERTVELYEALGVPRGRITFIKHETAAHAFITDDKGLACGVAGEPFIEDCDYDQAKAILETIYGPMRPANSGAGGQFLTFDQGPYLSDGRAGMAEEGVAYVPEGCRREAGCAVHVVFHGCKQGREAIGDIFIKESGYARWAEGNRIVLLFPQVKAGSSNPNGCWDWWGYTGRRYLEKSAPQMAAVYKMIERLTARR
jgi:hypothetical protein